MYDYLTSPQFAAQAAGGVRGVRPAARRSCTPSARRCSSAGSGARSRSSWRPCSWSGSPATCRAWRSRTCRSSSWSRRRSRSPGDVAVRPRMNSMPTHVRAPRHESRRTAGARRAVGAAAGPGCAGDGCRRARRALARGSGGGVFGRRGWRFPARLRRRRGRRQVVWIPSGTSDFGALEIRQIWSIAHRSKGPLPVELANRLLDRNGAVILGAWLTEPAGDEVGVIFAVQVAAETDALSLQSAIHAVATTADSMESELTGKDDF
ncbi:MAG: hypothetical protein MZW92_32815 [Comamonadaceae bacterium]|nr:hypothetical protein [Comamonadaceae bacterium]